MNRLTTNKEASKMGMLELAYNSCYAKDSKARYRDYNMDIDARELAKQLLKDHADSDIAFESDEVFDDWMGVYLQGESMDSIEGLIAVFYRNIWAMAELRERLKYYEDLEERGMLLKPLVAKGSTIYPLLYANGKARYIDELEVVEVSESRIWAGETCFDYADFGKTVFPTRKQAEQALKNLEEKM